MLEKVEGKIGPSRVVWRSISTKEQFAAKEESHMRERHDVSGLLACDVCTFGIWSDGLGQLFAQCFVLLQRTYHLP
jgi:hypothetical protein